MADSKSYVVIARKYRPQTFDEVAGQEIVGTILKNAIELDRVGHAYLFTGPRGVGKTSMARIFAKALNCKKGPTSKPCGECDACTQIEEARSLDVLEIDGASNRGIDEIRALRENVKFSPAHSKYKIYIIDEVHQITTDGFNALLKTLEEPPAHVKFIFATTSVDKIPSTILSRCQKFDFKHISATVIAETLKKICKSEKIKIDDEALYAIAKAAAGSLRDSQSILDQIASSSRDKITKKEVYDSLGALEEDSVLEITEFTAQKNAKGALGLFHRLLDEGKDPVVFLEKWLEHVRNLLVVSVADDLNTRVDGSDDYKAKLLKQKTLFSKNDLFYFLSVIVQTLTVLRRFEMKTIPVEMAIVKLADRSPVENISEALSELRSIEKKNPRIEITASPASQTSAREAQPSPTVEFRRSKRREKEDEVEEKEMEELPSEDISLKVEAPKNIELDQVWEPLLRNLKSEKISVAMYLAEGEPRALVENIAKISFPQKHSFHREFLETLENRTLIEKHLSGLLNQQVRIEFETVKEVEGRFTALKNSESLSSAKPDPESDATLKQAMNIFGGKIVN